MLIDVCRLGIKLSLVYRNNASAWTTGFKNIFKLCWLIFMNPGSFLLFWSLGVIIFWLFQGKFCTIRLLIELIDWKIEAKEVLSDLGLSNNYLVEVGHNSFNTR